MVDGNALRLALVTLAGACAVSGGVVVLLPAIVASDDVPLPGPAAKVLSPAAAAPEPSSTPASSFDTVRVEPDGSGLVAGQAEPGESVAILAGDEVVARTTADADGRFVAFLDLPASDAPVALSIRDGDGAMSDGTVILAPTGRAIAARVEAPAMTGPDADEAPPDAGPGTGASQDVEPAGVSADPVRVATADPLRVPGTPPAYAPEAAPGQGTAGAAAADVAAPALPPLSDEEGQLPVLLSDASGVRVIQPALPPGADPEVLDSVALDAIAYDVEGEVTVSGRGAGDGAVRLYLDNEAVAESVIGPDGQWSADLAGTAPGVYTLRVDELDAAGGVVSRIETPFQRERRDDIAAAMSGTAATSETIAVRTVQPGNTLWAIARERYNEPMMYVRVFEANRDRIRNPDLIYPGQVFVLPEIGLP